MEVTPIVQRLRRLRLLAETSESMLAELVKQGTRKRCQALETLYLQEDLPRAVHLVIAGMVNRETTMSDGVVIQHSRALPGDWLGLANATSRIAPYKHTAITADTSDLLSFGLSRLADLRTNQEFSHYLWQIAAREQLAEEERRLNSLSATRSYDKLILFLDAEVSRLQRRDVSTVHFPQINGTQQYFSDSIGVSRETVARDLQPLLAAGIIERTRGVRPIRYIVLNPAELSALARSPLLRTTLYSKVRKSKTHRRFSDVA